MVLVLSKPDTKEYFVVIKQFSKERKLLDITIEIVRGISFAIQYAKEWQNTKFDNGDYILGRVENIDSLSLMYMFKHLKEDQRKYINELTI